MLHGVVYCATNLLNQKKYVGSTVQVIDCNQSPLTIAKQRNQDRFRDENSPIANDMRKFGMENFSIEVLEDLGRSEDRTFLQEKGFELEKFWIAKLDTFNFGYNCSKDGKWSTPAKGCFCVELNMSFRTCQEAANFFGKNVSTIFDVLSGKQKHVKGENGICYHLVRK